MEEWEFTMKHLGTYAYEHLYQYDEWFRRLCDHVVKISDIAYYLLPEDFYVHYLRRRFREIPDPYITNDQLSVVLRASSIARNPDTFRLICDLYRKHFSEESACLKPRSLLHLSRCCVRHRLKENGMLPFGICELQIPCTLQNYLQLNS